MTKSIGAMYAQQRRDNETNAREDLKTILPAELYDSEIEGDKDLNPTTKTLIVAKNYIEALMSHNTQLQLERDSCKVEKDEAVAERTRIEFRGWKGEGRQKTMKSKFKSQNKPFLIASNLPAATLEEPIRQLRQVAQRIVHKAEERLMVDGAMTDALQKMLDDSSDLIIDEIEKIENAT